MEYLDNTKAEEDLSIMDDGSDVEMRKYPDSATGLLFSEQTEKALIEAVKFFESSQGYFQPEIIRKHADKFSQTVFQKHYFSFLQKCYEATGKRIIL